MSVLVFGVAAFVVTDEADVDGGEQRENEGLNQTDQDFEQTRDGRNHVGGDATQRVDEVFAAEDITVETEGKGNQTESDGHDFDTTDAQEDEAEQDPHREADFFLVRLVAEKIENKNFETGVAQDEISPSDERDNRQCERGVEVGSRRADGFEPLILDGADSRKEAAPVHQQDEDKEAAKGREYLADHALADDRLESIAQAGCHAFHERLALARDDFRSPDEDAYGNEDHGREDPCGQDRVRDWNAANIKEVSGLGIHALRVRPGERWN